ncbi:MAG: HipA protein [Thermoleophilia bacterium]|nr:HipA protein [Thermoleophilia bacterium]
MAEAIDLYVADAGVDLLVGQLYPHRSRRGESTTFTYADVWIARPGAYAIDPVLPLVSGPQQSPEGRPLFGALSDCAPDRWGRGLLKRAERQRAKALGATPRSLGEIDYLLGVRDDMRQGALRFSRTGTSEFLADDVDGVPHLVQLPRLLKTSDELERDIASDADLQALLRAGGSLGGARPKAHVIDGAGRAGIAKFPSRAVDEWDVMAWEEVTLCLARSAKIDTPGSRLERVDGRNVLILERFDRSGGRRVGYVSAMTLLEATDGDRRSYVELAEAVELESPRVDVDLEKLWRRVAFGLLVTNTDDHLRNHGFLRAGNGWRLSPMFDVNPNPEAAEPPELSTAIDLNDFDGTTDALFGVAESFRLTKTRALDVLREVVAATSQWRSAAAGCGLSRAAVEHMRPAFEHERAERARALTEGRS